MGGWRKAPGTQRGTKKDAKKEGWEIGASANSDAKFSPTLKAGSAC